MANDLPYRVKYSSGKDFCVKCTTEISKSSIQFAVMEQSMTDDCMEPKWYDWDCFFKNRRPISETVIDGFATLRYTHQMKIREQLNEAEQKSPKTTPEKRSPSDGISNTMQPHSSIKKSCIASINENDMALEKLIAMQNKEFFELRGKLKLNTNKVDRIAILKANNQFIPESNSEILNHVTDVLFFGAMSPCSLCKVGQFIFKNLRYSCTGNVSQWSKCSNAVERPVRIPPEIPTKYQIFLKGEFKVRTRILKTIQTLSDHDFELHAKQPLFDMKFFIIGETKRPREEIEKKIRLMGGNVATEIEEDIAAVISNTEEIQQMSKDMEMAKTYHIRVVPEDFIDDIIDNSIDSLINQKDLSDWGQKPFKRVTSKSSPDDGAVAGTSSYTENTSKTLSMKWKNGNLVDPDSKLDNVAHVYCVNDLSYCAILDFVDITTNKNSYFKIQLLESDTQPEYWLFESKGRIATSIGSVSVKPFKNLNKAIASFKCVYLERTGNEFGVEIFVKKPGKYNQMNIKNEVVEQKMLNSSIPSTLDEPIFKLMEMLFDVKQIKSVMEGEFSLDIEKMPLGKISKTEITEATDVLREISQLLKNKPTPENMIIDASNRFYSLIPHNFGIRRPPAINTHKILEKKFEMIKALLQMEIICSFFAKHQNEKQNHLDAFYKTLTGSVHISVLDSTSEEHREICKYVRNTQMNIRFRVVEIFVISRNEEIERYRQFEGSMNRRLLWHGTRTTSIVGILTNGLKISLSQIGSFGKGVYFADAVTKSHVYCDYFTVNGSFYYVLFLCEVALGRSEVRHRYNRDPLNNNFDSVRGVGINYPHPMHIRPDGLQVPNGRMHMNVAATLNFNEYIVYDEDRVKIRYLVKLKYYGYC